MFVYDLWSRDYMQPIESIPFHDIVCFTDVDKLQAVSRAKMFFY